MAEIYINESIKSNEKRGIELYLTNENIDFLYDAALHEHLTPSAFARVIFRVLKMQGPTSSFRKQLTQIIFDESRRV